MHITLITIITTIIIHLAMIFFLLSNPSSFGQQYNYTGSWIIGESDKLNFKYPSNWSVNVSHSRFDNYELLFFDLSSNASIQISEEAISSMNNVLMGNETQNYMDIYMMSNSPLSSTAKKIETYPKGKVSIAGLPAYSELYLDRGFAVLISLAFLKGNDSHYTIITASPSYIYDDVEPTMLEIIKSITSKNIQKPFDQNSETTSKPKDVIDNFSKYSEQVKKECLLRFSEIICNFLIK